MQVNVQGGAVPLVLIPGHMGSALDWRWQCGEFSSSREVIVPDSHHWLPSIREMAVDIARQLPARFDLVGWSMGGYIAFELYPLVRDRLRKAALVHTTAMPESEAARVRRRQLLRAIDVEGMTQTFAHEIPAGMADPTCLPAQFLELLLSERLRLGRHALENQIKALSTRVDARPLLSAWQCETLVVAGGRDTLAPLQCAEEIASGLAHATLFTFEDAGHCSPWERPGDFNALLRGFLR